MFRIFPREETFLPQFGRAAQVIVDAARVLDAMAEALLRISQLVTDFPEIVELDINPLMVYEAGRGAVAVDMRFVLKEKESKG